MDLLGLGLLPEDLYYQSFDFAVPDAYNEIDVKTSVNYKYVIGAFSESNVKGDTLISIKQNGIEKVSPICGKAYRLNHRNHILKDMVPLNLKAKGEFITFCYNDSLHSPSIFPSIRVVLVLSNTEPNWQNPNVGSIRKKFNPGVKEHTLNIPTNKVEKITHISLQTYGGAIINFSLKDNENIFLNQFFFHNIVPAENAWKDIWLPLKFKVTDLFLVFDTTETASGHFVFNYIYEPVSTGSVKTVPEKR